MYTEGAQESDANIHYRNRHARTRRDSILTVHSRTKRLPPVATFTWRRYITPLARLGGELRGSGDRGAGKFERAVPVAQATEVMNE